MNLSSRSLKSRLVVNETAICIQLGCPTYIPGRDNYYANGQFRKFDAEYHLIRKSAFAQILAQRVHLVIDPQTKFPHYNWLPKL